MEANILCGKSLLRDIEKFLDYVKIKERRTGLDLQINKKQLKHKSKIERQFVEHCRVYDELGLSWKVNPNTNIQLLSIEERKMLGRYKKKRK